MRKHLPLLLCIVCFFFSSCNLVTGGRSAEQSPKAPEEQNNAQKPIRVTARSLYLQNQRLMRQNTALMKKIVKLEEQLLEDRKNYEHKMTALEKTISLMEKHLTEMQKKEVASRVTPPKKGKKKTKKQATASTSKTADSNLDADALSALAASIEPEPAEISTPQESAAIEPFSLKKSPAPKETAEPSRSQTSPTSKKSQAVFQPVPEDTSEVEEQQVLGWEDDDLNPPAVPIKLQIKPGAKKYYNAAFKKYAQKDYQKASDAFKEFIVRFPGDQDADNAQFWVGYAQYHLGNYQQAENEFRKVLRNYAHRETKHGYKTPDTILMLGRIYLKRNKPIKARYYFEQVVARFPETRSALKAQMEIESLDSF